MKLIDILVRELPKRGGWPIESNGCRQFPDGEVCFSNVGKKPDFYTECATDVYLVWRKTVTPHVSREQYEAALAAKNEGWIEWGGGECPLADDALVEVRYRNEKSYHIKGINVAGKWNWRHDDHNGDIIAYRLHQPQESEQPEASEEDLNECIGQAPATAWNGEGLPPVGCVCDVLYDEHEVLGNTWLKAKIISHDDGNVVGRWLEGNTEHTLFDYAINHRDYRPLRTDAERKRDAAVEIMTQILCSPSQASAIAKKIYNAIAAGEIPGVKLED